MINMTIWRKPVIIFQGKSKEPASESKGKSPMLIQMQLKKSTVL